MKKTYAIIAAAMMGLNCLAATEYPTGSGIYYDWDSDGKFYVSWVDKDVNLGDVVVPATVEIDGYSYAPTYFGEYTNALWGNTTITSLTIEAPISEVGGWKFENCTSLTSVKITGACTSIGEKAFSGCTSLSSLTLPEGCTTIGASAFWSAPIADVALPGSVTTIGNYAFSGNTALKSISFAGVPTTVGEGIVATGADYADFTVNVDYANLAALKTTLDKGNEGLNYKVPTATIDEVQDNKASIATALVESLTVKRTLHGGYWNTLVLPVAMTQSQMKASFGNDVRLAELTGVNGQTVGFSSTSGDLEANKPYLLWLKNDVKEFTLTEAWLSGDFSTLTTSADGCSFVGTLDGAAGTVPSGSYFIEGDKLYVSSGSSKLQAMRAYLTLSGGASEAKAFSIDGVTTAIHAIEAAPVSEEVYSLSGLHLDQAPKSGLFIKGGKKYVAR